MYNGNDLKVWKKFIIDWEPYQVLTYSQKVVWRWGSIINIKIKNLVTGSITSKTLSDKDSFAPADIASNSYEYLYNDGENYYFMSKDTFEQVSLVLDALWGSEKFLAEWDKVVLQEFNGNPINISLEPSVILEVEDTPPGEKWNTVTWGKKPATMTTGLVVQVPLFVNPGDKIKVDTNTKEYLARA